MGPKVLLRAGPNIEGPWDWHLDGRLRGTDSGSCTLVELLMTVELVFVNEC